MITVLTSGHISLHSPKVHRDGARRVRVEQEVKKQELLLAVQLRLQVVVLLHAGHAASRRPRANRLLSARDGGTVRRRGGRDGQQSHAALFQVHLVADRHRVLDAVSE